MTYNASTLGLDAGAPIIEIETGEVVALHFAGDYLKANYAVPMYELARDPRVAPRLNFEETVAATSDFDPAWRSVKVVKPKYHVSYAWADPTDPDREKIVDQACEEAAATRHFDHTGQDHAQGRRQRIEVHEPDRQRGRDICLSQRQVSQIAVRACLSYFEIWRVNRQDETEFLARVRIYVLPDAKISYRARSSCIC